MPKIKVDDDELPLDELEGAEYDEDSEGSFEPYDGPLPPKNTKLWGYVKMWWSMSKAGDRKLVTLFVAADNPPDKAKYNGLPVWEHTSLTPNVKFKWYPLLRIFGLTIRDVKFKLNVEDEDDNIGAPITKIANVKFGPDSDDAYCCIITAREKYGDEWQTRVGKWLEWTDPVAQSTNGDEPDDEEEEEPEEEEAPPARGRRAKAKAEPEPVKAKAGRGSRRQAEPKEEPAAPKRGRGRRAGGAPGGEADDDPPF